MPIEHINGIDICFEVHGDGEPLVLINGLGSQMIRWPAGFIELLVGEGFRVITFDNRDVGLSTKFDDATESPAYTVDDMAADVVGLLDHLSIDTAHIVGQSMGGMIGQVVALKNGERVRSFASVMSSTGDNTLITDDKEVASVLTEPAATERMDAIEQDVRHRRLLSGRGFDFDEDAMRDLAARTYDRCYSPAGRARQMFAVIGSPGRSAALADVKVPTVVIHGTDDRSVPFENGKRTAEAIPGAELVAIEGMGHDLPRGAWEQVVSAITANTKRA